MTHRSQHIELKHLTNFSKALNQLAEIAEGRDIDHSPHASFAAVVQQATVINPWFTKENIAQALQGLSVMLRPEALQKWLETYDFSALSTQKRVGLILAGNIPMVGFHDIFSVAVAGHIPVVKQSSQDHVLLPYVFNMFRDLSKNEAFNIEWVDGKLPEVDAVIATGSNNTARYFEYYFGKYPHIIRKNRSGVAILTGNETDEELSKLGSDIFSFFGLGCRNVAKLYVHRDFDLDRFFKGIYEYHPIVNHHKYANNYDYFRALWLMNREEILDNGFLILRPSTSLSSPVGSVFYERFDDLSVLEKELATQSDEIQCIVSQNHVPFGKSQQPELWDYADGVDTMKFLLEL